MIARSRGFVNRAVIIHPTTHIRLTVEGAPKIYK
ncbi:hypothetical protein SAMN05444275_11555 [Myroides odoratimimus subsp. xuanwuensis]|nr:hypothetical protein SAMN05444275_11555 [Myroides odoratimimus subsp. xuanwuensis]